MTPISIAFVDDHPILLAGIVQIFGSNAGFKTLGFGKCADDALDIAVRLQPDVLVLDLNMPGKVLETISEVARNHVKTRILVFTAVTGVDHATNVLEAGAHGYVLKGSSEDELVHAARAVHSGETFISPSFATKVIAGLRTASLRRATAVALRLSSREEQIMRLLLRGNTNREIAAALSISDKTVKHYMTVLMQRLNVRNRIEVVLAAQEMGIETSSAALPAMN